MAGSRTPPKLRLRPLHSTLFACAAFEVAGEPDDVSRLCRELARVEGWSPIAIRYWLAKLWGEELVTLAGTRPTAAGWALVRGGGGDEERAAA